MELKDLNIIREAKRYGIPLWQHPQVLFLFMGITIGAASIFFYLLGRQYITDPRIAALAVIFLTGTLLTLAYLVTQSFERIIEAARLKSEFVSIVSHELRSPLSNLTWAIEFLMSGKPGSVKPEQTDYFRILKENSSRMQTLVNDLLTVSRLEQGRLLLRMENVSFPEYLDEILRGFQYFLRAANIELRVEREKGSLELFTDPSRLREVISNLVDNAIKYTAKAKGALAPEERKDTGMIIRYRKTNGNLHVEIQDNGVGIPKQDQKHIFTKFFRSQNALRNETQGSGLGLYIAKSIIKELHGHMGFRSKENEGSTFWFTIPIHS